MTTGTDVTTVLWEQHPFYGFVIEPAERMRELLAVLQMLREARTVGELRTAHLPEWAADVVQVTLEHLADEGERRPDAAAWDWNDRLPTIYEHVPLPWDAEVVRTWLDTDLISEHLTVSGASPAGNIDGYEVVDRPAFLQALEDRGYTLEERPGMIDAYHEAL